MKKSLLIICLAAASLISYAQSHNDHKSTITFGIKGGGNLLRFQETFDNSSGKTKSYNQYGFHAGIYVNINLDDHLAVQPQVLYTNKAGKLRFLQNSVDRDLEPIIFSGDQKFTLNYLHLPIDVIYKIPVSNNKFFFGVGPFISYCLNGKAKAKIYNYTGSNRYLSAGYDGKATFRYEPGSVKRFDYGINAIVGFKLRQGFVVSANYDLGLAEIQKDLNYELFAYPPNPENNIKTRVASLSIGYEF
ncbi:porin family protein [Mucilaginibacter limnophilus]|uniref:porin family protein n=1 Tax=Mucilaginibacter limnophilus TaxID=1932778 RepID=UPI0013E2CEF9|nr:porin family protein [Mucilaginibacter limnophilus]